MGSLIVPLRLRWGFVNYDFDNEILGRCRDGTEFTIKASADQVHRWLEKGEFVQDVFPELSLEDREILISGTSPAQFDAMFKEDEQ